MHKLLFFFFAALIAFSACRKQELKDDELIQAYLADSSFTATATVDGVYYIMLTEGTGVQPTISNTVDIDYEGRLLDGTLFDAGTGSQFVLGQLIQGFQIGMPYFKTGGKGILLIPSHLGYGKNAVGSIPKNSVLRFDITLNDVL